MRLTYILFFLLFIQTISGQITIDKDYFRSPIDFQTLLSSSFGELRGGHFHAGIDFKTNGVEGKKVYAVADGYIFRIKISIHGYGNAIYIAHPNGYTSVYGHLKEFAIHIDEYLKHFQYKKQSFTMDLLLKENEIEVKKGEVIALSGNSGGSLGPHIHFEIRETDTHKPVNPLLAGFEITDNVKPKIHSITLYPLDSYSYINGKNEKLRIYSTDKKGDFSLNIDDSIIVSGKIGFGIHANDYHNYTHNKCGIYSLKLLLNDTLIYEHKIDKFSFANARFINSHMDYEEYMKTKIKIHQCFLDPYNNLGIYKNILNNGIVEFKSNNKHSIEFVLSDEYGNSTNLQFNVFSRINNLEFDSVQYDSTLIVMPFNKKNEFKNDLIEILFPEYAFYDTIYFDFDMIESVNLSKYKIYQIHNKYEPVHKKFNLKIKNTEITDRLTDKTFIALLIGENKFNVCKTEVKDSFFISNVKKFGLYTLVIDTISPALEMQNDAGQKLSVTDRIEIKGKDQLSGIKEFNGYINDQWVLFEYDKKTDLFWHSIDKGYELNSTITLNFVVKDNAGNITNISEKFIYTDMK